LNEGNNDDEFGQEPLGALAADELHALWGEEEHQDVAAVAKEQGPVGLMPQFSEPRATPLDPTAAFEELRSRVLEIWGYDSLRPLQEDAMRASIEGRDGVVVLPTGGGKSLCYQAPALVREGLTVVVSPLIALMKDQLDGLLANGVPAGMLTSAQDSNERRETMTQLRSGRLKLLFCSPERLVMDGFYGRLLDHGLSAIAVDEAHCISHWGHDFRPEYRMLGELRRSGRPVPIMAYTATATPRVREDIAAQLGLQSHLELVGNFDRPNLTYRVIPRSDLVEQAMQVVNRHEGQAGIIYSLRRKDVEKLAADLARKGVRCLPYHAGLAPPERKRVQEAFLNEGIDVVVATVAFGMGIDRPDVRFVIHASLPKGVEQYSQETGRAGRDGLAAECVMLYSGADYHGWRGLMERSAKESEMAGQTGAMDEFDQAMLRLDDLWGYACGTNCRHRFLVEFFGGTYEQPGSAAPEAADEDEQADAAKPKGCGACDVCLGELEIVEGAQVIAQKIISCVVRCDQRYGAAHVTDVLRGADTARIRSAGHDKLTTHGLLSKCGRSEVRAWIDQLLGAGHLGVAPGPYPTVHLTPSGLEVMRGEREVSLFRPRKARASSTRARRGAALAAEDDGPAPDEALFEVLRKLRKKLSAERGVPPYILFNDRTLAGLAAHQPKEEHELLGIKGIGAKKAADLGPAFMEAIAEWLKEQPEKAK
jgi:ATP-dependent DNA helicase RecQ